MKKVDKVNLKDREFYWYEPKIINDTQDAGLGPVLVRIYDYEDNGEPHGLIYSCADVSISISECDGNFYGPIENPTKRKEI